MILSCNSCEKKFVVPDKAITSAGRIVQCGSCGNKWKQFPVNIEIKKTPTTKKTQKVKKPKIVKISSETKIPIPKKKKTNKKREIDLYSPEYLAKKHGIELKDAITNSDTKKSNSLGFYSSLMILIVIVIAFSRSLYFFQDFIIEKLPITEFYLEYFFESIRNLFEIWKNLITNY